MLKYYIFGASFRFGRSFAIFNNMVLGLLALAGIPTTISIAQARSSANQQQKQKDKRSQRDVECNIRIYCHPSSHSRAKEIHGKTVVFRDNKVYVSKHPVGENKGENEFSGFYMAYPEHLPGQGGSNDGNQKEEEEKPQGLVSMVSKNPPALGFLYADRNTGEVKYGNRSTSIEHIWGPWDWTDEDVNDDEKNGEEKDDEAQGIVLEDQEAFVAVEEQKNVWAVYYDKEDDGKCIPDGALALVVNLERVPKKKK